MPQNASQIRRVLLLVILALALVGCGSDEMPAQQSAATETPWPTSMPPCDILPTPTSTPEVTPSATPLPSATPTPYRLVVDEVAWVGSEGFWGWLDAELPDVAVWHAAEASAATPAEGRIVETWAPAESDLLLRAEPFVWVSHHAASVSELEWDALADLAQDGWQLVTTVEGQSLLGQLLPETACTVTEADLAAGQAAGDQRVLALLPWEAVDVRVRALPFLGARFEPAAADTWPLRHCLVLQTVAPAPAGLVERLQSLAYRLPATVSLAAVGDVMLARNVGAMIQKQGADYPFAASGIAPWLRDADVTFGNLENAVSTGGRQQAKSYTFRAEPGVLEGLVEAGFDVVSLANNHTCDYGPEALRDTVALVEQAGLLAAGAGEDLARARQAQMIERQGLRMAFLAYNQIGPRWMDALDDRPGSAYADPQTMVEDVRAAAAQADLVIVSCHWGVEHANYTTAFQRDLTRQLWEAGATLILGHHPHVVQGLALEQGRCAVYSMGNFVFDMGTPGSRDGYAVRCLLDASGVKQIELLPYHIEGYRPQFLDEAQSQAAIKRVYALTTKAGGWAK